MRKYSTPTFNITIKYRDGTVASDLEFDYVLFTLTDECAVIERNVPYEEVTEGRFFVELTQAETGALSVGNAEAELNVMNGNRRIASSVKRVTVSKNLHNEVIINGL